MATASSTKARRTTPHQSAHRTSRHLTPEECLRMAIDEVYKAFEIEVINIRLRFGEWAKDQADQICGYVFALFRGNGQRPDGIDAEIAMAMEHSFARCCQRLVVTDALPGQRMDWFDGVSRQVRDNEMLDFVEQTVRMDALGRNRAHTRETRRDIANAVAADTRVTSLRVGSIAAALAVAMINAYSACDVGTKASSCATQWAWRTAVASLSPSDQQATKQVKSAEALLVHVFRDAFMKVHKTFTEAVAA